MYCVKCGKQIKVKEAEKCENFCKGCYKGTEKYEKKRKKRVILTIITLVVALIVVSAWYFCKHQIVSLINKNISGNQVFNLTSSSKNVYQIGDWIIYSNGTFLKTMSGVISVDGFKDGIYKYNIKTGQLIELDGYNGHSFNVYDNKLYYISSETNQIQYKDIDTLQAGKIAWISQQSYKASYLLLYNDKIFYRDYNGDNIYCTNLEGTNKRLIAEYTTGDIKIENGFIYYIDKKSYHLYRKKINNIKDEIFELTDEVISNFDVRGNMIIWLSGNTIKSKDLETLEIKILQKDNVTSNFIVSENNIYFYSSNAKSFLSYNIETQKVEELGIEKQEILKIQYYNKNIYYAFTDSTSNKYTKRLELYCFNVEDKKKTKISF